jgi:glucose/arabinose dehydrogenase
MNRILPLLVLAALFAAVRISSVRLSADPPAALSDANESPAAATPAAAPATAVAPADAPTSAVPPLSPEAEAATFRLADENLVVELVAAEPTVVSPVALAWDAGEKMYVAEMEDYPVGPDKGRIRLLEDRDHDGRYETATVFAAGISFPTSVLPVRGGLLVAAAPDILFLEDTDGDGVADRREVLLTGFGEGNQQLRVNGLTWGADNWIYGANGRSNGEIRRPQDPPEKAVSIGPTAANSRR